MTEYNPHLGGHLSDELADNEIPIDIYDNRHGQIPDLEPGFYFTIPMNNEPDDDGVQSMELDVLAGPYETEEEALDAAQTFIFNTLAEVVANEEEGDDDDALSESDQF